MDIGVQEKLIELVKDNAVLYDTENKNYNDFGMKSRIWDEIGQECSVESGYEAKRMWNRLRDAFRSSVKRVDSNKSVETANGVKLWKFYEQMSFLKTFMKERKRIIIENYDGVDSIADYLPCGEEFCKDSGDVSSTKRQLPDRERDPALEFLIERVSEDRQKVRDDIRRKLLRPTDDLKLFFDAMYETTRKLPPYLQRTIKRKLFKIIIKAEEIVDQKDTLIESSPSISDLFDDK